MLMASLLSVDLHVTIFRHMAARHDEREGEFCSCANNINLRTDVPNFVGNDYYCEAGHTAPLSDGHYETRPTSWLLPCGMEKATPFQRTDAVTGMDGFIKMFQVLLMM